MDQGAFVTKSATRYLGNLEIQISAASYRFATIGWDEAEEKKLCSFNEIHASFMGKEASTALCYPEAPFLAAHHVLNQAKECPDLFPSGQQWLFFVPSERNGTPGDDIYYDIVAVDWRLGNPKCHINRHHFDMYGDKPLDALVTPFKIGGCTFVYGIIGS